MPFHHEFSISHSEPLPSSLLCCSAATAAGRAAHKMASRCAADSEHDKAWHDGGVGGAVLDANTVATRQCAAGRFGAAKDVADHGNVGPAREGAAKVVVVARVVAGAAVVAGDVAGAAVATRVLRERLWRQGVLWERLWRQGVFRERLLR